MSGEPTTTVIQRYLNALAGDKPAEPIVRALLDRSVRRLQMLCTNLLYRKYRRLTLPPVNLQPEEMLDAVVERLLKAMRSVRPQTVRQFFALVNQHMRWELNDVARRLDERPIVLDSRRPGAGADQQQFRLKPRRMPHAPGHRRSAGGRA